MAELSYKEFMDRLKAHLETFSLEDYKNLIIDMAGKEPPSKRREFLERLTPQKEVIDKVEELLDEIEQFAQRVEEGEYCDGWGWDDDIHDERDWGDESWALEMDAYFLQARTLILQGEYKFAKNAYAMLFDTLALGEEPGHLPGRYNPDCMLTVDIEEQLAIFLRAIYLDTASESRPALLYQTMNTYSYLVVEFKLKDIINALDGPLPDLDLFLTDWIKFLKPQKGIQASALLREAILMKGGLSAIAELARSFPEQYPKAYVDWLTALEDLGDITTLIKVAKEGLEKIPKDFKVRAEVAEFLARTGEQLNDNELKLEGYKESFYSDPSLKCLLDLYLIAKEEDRFEEIKSIVEDRVIKLEKESWIVVNGYYCSEQDRTALSKGILPSALLLSGNYEKVLEMCTKKGSLGWSLPENPKPLLITFMMLILSKDGIYTTTLNSEWEKAIRNTNLAADKEYVEKYKQIINDTKNSLQLTTEQEAFYLKWCLEELDQRIEAIISNKYRESYYKAAQLLVAMAETLANREGSDKARDLIVKYKGKYPKYSAFQREVRRALQGSDFDVTKFLRK